MSEPKSDRPLTSSVERLRQELDHWLEVAWSQGERALDKFGIREGETAWVPNVDVVGTAEEVLVTVDLPGVDADKIEVGLAGNMLTIEGERPPSEYGDNDTVYVAQRPRGAFRRSVPMPVAVDHDAVKAETKEGVLIVTLSKAEREKSKQIPVSKASGKPQTAGGGTT